MYTEYFYLFQTVLFRGLFKCHSLFFSGFSSTFKRSFVTVDVHSFVVDYLGFYGQIYAFRRERPLGKSLVEGTGQQAGAGCIKLLTIF